MSITTKPVESDRYMGIDYFVWATDDGGFCALRHGKPDLCIIAPTIALAIQYARAEIDCAALKLVEGK